MAEPVEATIGRTRELRQAEPVYTTIDEMLERRHG